MQCFHLLFCGSNYFWQEDYVAELPSERERKLVHFDLVSHVFILFYFILFMLNLESQVETTNQVQKLNRVPKQQNYYSTKEKENWTFSDLVSHVESIKLVQNLNAESSHSRIIGRMRKKIGPFQIQRTQCPHTAEFRVKRCASFCQAIQNKS